MAGRGCTLPPCPTAHPPQVAVAGAAWCPAMARALLAGIAAREGRYPHGSSLEGDTRALGRWAAADRSERAAAARGALQLRVAERTLLAQASAAARALL